ncbi:kinase-like protein [Aspergillus japonicus CBS 114.51]|uniref:Kinase-like protein n=1 Tax=Aspergillus japonicus CBS 114.51 TaxID=1448312 RepID=A0A8T8XCB5_ASPJA|nr:kinase-like protein [Aspergillus japonicus CBS 114.51]RAH85893.1 kinase-like protein [Aspergillus japonicus CBS 114.51]
MLKQSVALLMTSIGLSRLSLSWFNSPSPTLPSEPQTDSHISRGPKVPECIESWETYKSYRQQRQTSTGLTTRKVLVADLQPRVVSSQLVEDEDPYQTTVFTDQFRLEIDQEDILGRGASGFVYGGTWIPLSDASDRQLDLLGQQDVAVKVSHDPWLLWEAHMMNLVQGNHVIRATATFTIPQPNDTQAQDGAVYAMVMPRFRGSLQSWANGLPPANRARQTLPVMLQMVEALVQLHRQGFAHQDLKLGNMVYDRTPTGEMRVLISDLDRVTRSRYVRGSAGTLGYLSQEILLGKTFDPMSSDVFAMGMALLHLAFDSMSGQDFRMLVWRTVVDAAKPSKVKQALVDLFGSDVNELPLDLFARALCEQEGHDDGEWKRRITSEELLTELRAMIDGGLW